MIEHQLIGHVDLAGSFSDRVLITATMPVLLLEQVGTPAAGAAPATGVVISDPRIGLWVRLFGQPYRSAVSMSIGAKRLDSSSCFCRRKQRGVKRFERSVRPCDAQASARWSVAPHHVVVWRWVSVSRACQNWRCLGQ